MKTKTKIFLSCLTTILLSGTAYASNETTKKPIKFKVLNYMLYDGGYNFENPAMQKHYEAIYKKKNFGDGMSIGYVDMYTMDKTIHDKNSYVFISIDKQKRVAISPIIVDKHNYGKGKPPVVINQNQKGNPDVSEVYTIPNKPIYWLGQGGAFGTFIDNEKSKGRECIELDRETNNWTQYPI